jgi:uncharacterized protein
VSGREPAWRVFASELQGSRVDEKGTGERAASYVLSPLGARMNRVLLVGTLSPPETLGTDEPRPFLRCGLTDPTGTVTVTAGGYQPRALASLKAIGEPKRQMVVGKAHLFIGRNGTPYPSVRAEALRAVSDSELGDLWAEALDQTLTRIELLEAIRSGRAPPEGARIPPAWKEPARAAASQYPSVDPASFRAGLAAVVRTLEDSDGPAGVRASPVRPPEAPPGAPLPATDITPPRVRVTRAAPPPPAASIVTAAGRAQESLFLDIVDELSDRSADGYSDLREAIGLAARRGLSGEDTERVLNRLEEEGVLEEPVVGKIRRA